jgi:hypothetical protein
MEFEIFDDDTSGTSRWGPETHSSVDVINGIVNVVLGLTNGIEPSELDYNECWLQIKVRYPEGSWETLTPRQRVTGAPYAVLAQDADKLDGLNSTAFIQTETDPTITDASIKDGISWTEVSNRPAGLDDGDQVGITSETDPEVTASSNKTVVGVSAGHASTGTDNTFIGNNAGQSNTSTGTLNTFIGSNAGSSNTTGDANTFIGAEAGLNNTNGGANTCIGWLAGKSNVSGNSNVYLGYWAGEQATGSRNTFVGQATGKGNTGSGNVFIGYSVGYSSSTSSEKLLIGNSSINTLISGDFSNSDPDNKKVTIQGKLEILGNKAEYIVTTYTGDAYPNQLTTDEHTFCALTNVAIQTAEPGNYKGCRIEPNGDGTWELYADATGNYQAGAVCKAYCF